MMSSLEEIEQYAGYTEFDLTGKKAIPKSVVLKVEHYDWLIKQAERVEELEEKIKMLKISYNHNTQAGISLMAKNQRYKQDLEFYADVKNHDNPVIETDNARYLGQSNIDKDGGKKARQALANE